MRELDNLVIEAKFDQQLLHQLVLQYEFSIIKYASKATHRYITKSDDEWSIALHAFTQAIHSYQLDKGSFLKFAELVIHRRLIDYGRKENKYRLEVSVDPIIFDTEPDENDEDMALRMAVADKVSRNETNNLKLEIQTLNEIFSLYGFSFYDLSECSPQAKKTKTSCAIAINFLLQNPVICNELKSKNQLPIKIIEKNAKIPRKLLERHRKYIIAGVEILSGEYPYLAEYFRYVREENEK